jgi:hypothetical protein
VVFTVMQHPSPSFMPGIEGSAGAAIASAQKAEARAIENCIIVYMRK